MYNYYFTIHNLSVTHAYYIHLIIYNIFTFRSSSINPCEMNVFMLANSHAYIISLIILVETNV